VVGNGDLDGKLKSELLTEGTFSYTFDDAGTFTYHCTPHPMMVGTVIVQ
jgi:plastocyanin